MWLYPVLFSSLPLSLSLLYRVHLLPMHQNSLPLLNNQLQVELNFKTGEVILVYCEMDEDGFYMGEVDGLRGLVPSNFLTESPATNGAAVANNRNGRVMSSVGATRGPQPPNMGGGSGGIMGGPNQRAQPGIRKGMWPVKRRCVNQSPPNTQFSFRILSNCH